MSCNPLRRLTNHAGAVCAAAMAALMLVGPVSAKDVAFRVQGLFCNLESQLDRALDDIDRGVSPQAAAGLVNSAAVVCTYVDLLHYVVAAPVNIGVGRGRLPVIKYRGTLVGVLLGGELRGLVPPAEVFFVTPQPIASAAVERRL